MSDAPPSSVNDSDTHAAKAQAALWRQVELLEMLAETGVQFAQTLAAQAGAAPAERPEAIAMAFSRVARAVRMTALLQSRLIKDLDEAKRRAAFAAPDREDHAAEEAARQDPAYGHKARVEAIVARVAKAQIDDDDERVERIVNEAADRLDDEDIYGDVLTRPVGELVALICRDLRLEPNWERLAREAWAQAEIQNETEGSPFLPLPPGGVLDIACDVDGQVGRGGDAGLKWDAQSRGRPHPQPFYNRGRRESFTPTG